MMKLYLLKSQTNIFSNKISLRLILCILASFSFFIHDAQVPVSLYEQFNGRYDFVMIGNTLNTYENNLDSNCNHLSISSSNLNLNSSQTIVRAYLYWAGSGAGDFNINLNGNSINDNYPYYLYFQDDTGNILPYYFSAFKDVTELVQQTGNGSYTVTGLEIETTNLYADYCDGNTNFGGWSILVIYEDQSLPLNQLNVYDGFEVIPEQINFILDNLNVVDPEGSKIGFLAWEGDASLADNESLRINNVTVSNSLNPSTNAFNSTNSFTNSSELYNMDIDVYDVSNYLQTGDTFATVQLTSSADVVFINTVISVLNSEVPDATIVLSEDFQSNCGSRDIEISYIVSNLNSTAIIPSNTPISFYVQGDLVGQTQTNQDIPIDGQEEGSMVINIDEIYGDSFQLTAVVDDTGNGSGVVTEIDETNNSYDLVLNDIFDTTYANQISDLILCDDDSDGSSINGQTQIDFSFLNNAILGDQDPSDYNISYYLNQDDANNSISPLSMPYYNEEAFNYSVFARLESNTDPSCFDVTSFDVQILATPTANMPEDLFLCVQDGITTIDLSSFQSEIIGDQNSDDFILSFYTTNLEAQEGISPINPLITVSSNQTIYARIDNIISSDCYDITSFELNLFNIPSANSISTIELCDDGDDDNSYNGQININLDELSSSILLDQDPNSYSVSYHLTQYDADLNLNPLPEIYYNTIPYNYQIFTRVENNQNSNCFDTGVIDVEIYASPEANAVDDVYVCDQDYDQIVSFDFEQTIEQVLGTSDLLDFNVSFFTSYEDAFSYTNSIILPYENTELLEELFIRIENDFNDDCFDIVSFKIYVNYDCPVEPSQAVSPNGDGINDIFHIVGLYDIHVNHTLKIYNRYGAVVFKGDNSKKWDGTSNVGTGSGLLPVGTYFYAIELNDDAKNFISGWVYLNY